MVWPVLCCPPVVWKVSLCPLAAVTHLITFTLKTRVKMSFPSYFPLLFFFPPFFLSWVTMDSFKALSIDDLLKQNSKPDQRAFSSRLYGSKALSFDELLQANGFQRGRSPWPNGWNRAVGLVKWAGGGWGRCSTICGQRSWFWLGCHGSRWQQRRRHAQPPWWCQRCPARHGSSCLGCVSINKDEGVGRYFLTRLGGEVT